MYYDDVDYVVLDLGEEGCGYVDFEDGGDD